MPVTKNGYVIVSPGSPNKTTVGPGGPEIMYFKIGSQTLWDSTKPEYSRANPDYWYRSFRIEWQNNNNNPNNVAPGPGDIIGNDSCKQVLIRMLDTNTLNGGQHAFNKVYPGVNTEWWSTTNANCIQAIRDMMNQWDTTWAQGAQMPGLNPNHNARNSEDNTLINVGTVRAGQDAFTGTGAAMAVITVGPVFDRVWGPVWYFRQRLGIGSNYL